MKQKDCLRGIDDRIVFFENHLSPGRFFKGVEQGQRPFFFLIFLLKKAF